MNPELHALQRTRQVLFLFSFPLVSVINTPAIPTALHLNTDLLDLNTTIVFNILAFVVGNHRAAFGIVVSASLETLHLSRLHVVEVLLAEMDATDLVADNVCLDVLLALCLFRIHQYFAPITALELDGQKLPQVLWASS